MYASSQSGRPGPARRSGGSQRRGRWKSVLVVALAIVWSQSGCEQRGSPGSAAKAAAGDARPAPEKTSSGSKKPGAKKKGKSSKGSHIGEIPRDAWPEVFFDDPLDVAADKTVLGAPSRTAQAAAPDTSDEPAMSPMNDEPPPAAVPAAPGDWASVLPEEVLADEVKAIKSSLAAKLQSVGIYNGKYKELRVDAAALVALAGLVGEHPANPSWKPNARYIRDASAQIVKSATANGQKFYKPSKEAYEQLESLLSGSKPPGLEESAETLPYTEVSSREQLMYRIERAFNYLKSTVNTADTMKKESAKVKHEASLLAALAKVLASPGNSDADDSEYHNFAGELEQAGLGIAGAAVNSDFEAYTRSLDRASKACTSCHLYIK